MTIIRFETASEVFETYPFLAQGITPPVTDSDPLAHLRLLAGSSTPEEAVTFLAFVLPRRHAVYWGCGCVRALLGASRDLDQDQAMLAALAWLKHPEEAERAEALTIGMEMDKNSPSVWLALAAGWTGGSMAVGPKTPVVIPPPDLTGRGVNTAVLLALALVHHTQRDKEIGRCVEYGLKVADAG